MAIVTTPLPVTATLEHCIRLAREGWRDHRTPLIALAVLYAIRFLLRPAPHPGDMPGLGSFGFYGFVSLGIGIASLGFVVGTHRWVLRREHRPGLDYFRFDRPTWRYLGYSLAIGVAALISIAIVGALGAMLLGKAVVLLELVLGAVWVAIGVRLSLLFPALAIGEPITVRQAWEQSRGNGWRIFAGLIAIGLGFGLVSGLLGAIFMGAGLIGSLIGAVLVGPVQAALTFLGTIYLSLAYDAIVRGGAGPSESVRAPL